MVNGKIDKLVKFVTESSEERENEREKMSGENECHKMRKNGGKFLIKIFCFPSKFLNDGIFLFLLGVYLFKRAKKNENEK